MQTIRADQALLPDGWAEDVTVTLDEAGRIASVETGGAGDMRVGILLPALGAARRQAIAVSCASNLKQLGLGIGMYYNDYPSTLP